MPHKPRQAELSPNMEDYLETIYLQDLEGHSAKVKDIAKAMGVSKPSVTEALSVLQDRGLVLHQKYGDVELTDRGRATAEDIYSRHQLLYDFFTKVLDVDEDVADDDACKVEHLVSEETITRFGKFMEYLFERSGDGKECDFIKEFKTRL